MGGGGTTTRRLWSLLVGEGFRAPGETGQGGFREAGGLLMFDLDGGNPCLVCDLLKCPDIYNLQSYPSVYVYCTFHSRECRGKPKS